MLRSPLRSHRRPNLPSGPQQGLGAGLRGRARRGAATTATLAVAMTGAAVLSQPPAQAALVPTDYGFYASAFGTTARAESLGLSSGRTALSTIGCTRLAGKKKTRSQAGVDTPANVPTLGIGAVTSTTQTYKENGSSGARATNRIANLRIGLPQGPNLMISGLETTSSAWADRGGKFHTSGSFRLGDIQANTGVGPVDQLLNRVGVTAGDLVQTILAQSGNALEIPGVGRISLGAKSPRVRAGYADINTVSLKVQLYGQNQKLGGGDDVAVVVGRSYAKVIKNMPAAVMGGVGYGADVQVLGGLIGVNELGRKPMPCQGTDGRVVSSQSAGADAGNLNALGLGAARARIFGKQFKNGAARAWTEGRVTGVSLNLGGRQLDLQGIIGRAAIRKTRAGKLIMSTKGTQVGTFKLDGSARRLNELERNFDIPGVATFKFGVTRKAARSLRVIALQIVLVPALAQETGLAKIDLGVAKVRMRRM